ncbi:MULTISPECIES: ABC transporter ATP-binding protein [Arthrobacter]|uniref:ABC transporter ATP-binding protein n=2 Tax=Arthrobacter TaxID=1663 RepID=A0ABU9KK47_9MICC|nr:ABC transporter ATP-binding protein [Arthrobacter sp. YJM1]MDP5227061.1 ABC transporter ATP-binding protein [Arthrobacter sp. YJM1]
MREYPYPRPDDPFGLSPGGFLLWMGRRQLPTLLGGFFFGIVWMLSQAFAPFVIGRALDLGVVGQDFSALLLWTSVFLGLAVVQAITTTVRHRLAVSNWLQAALTTKELIGVKVARGGESVGRAVPTGEIVTAASNDAPRLGQLFDVTARLSGSVISYLVVSVLVAQIHLPLGIAVLIGVPALGALLVFVVRPFQRRQQAQREATGRMTSVGADTVAGLRVLRGIGGERIFVNRYRERSQHARVHGVEVARSVATLEASQLLIGGAFSVFFTFSGAALALDGTITVGELMSLYGFSVFLVAPIRTGSEALNVGIRGIVGARKVSKLLAAAPLVADRGTVAEPTSSSLVDGVTGVTVPPHGLTALVCADPGRSAAVAKRLGRFDDGESRQARWGDEPLTSYPLEAVRRRIVFSQAEAQLFTGSLRTALDPQGRHDDGRIIAALRTAAALDILEAVDEGLDHEVDEKGRSFSGGQRQRLSLARALLSDAEFLLLVEPTSAVDAHTEARIASGLAESRGGRSSATLVTTASPLLLHAMDRVVFLPATGTPLTGTHAGLLDSCPEYRTVVIRSE